MDSKIQSIEDSLHEIIGLLSRSHGRRDDSPSTNPSPTPPVPHQYKMEKNSSRSSANCEEVYHQGAPVRQAKIDFSRYSGEDPTVWLNRMTQYFDYQCTPEKQRRNTDSRTLYQFRWMAKLLVALPSTRPIPTPLSSNYPRTRCKNKK